jgi:hypothetical protein
MIGYYVCTFTTYGDPSFRLSFRLYLPCHLEALICRRCLSGYPTSDPARRLSSFNLDPRITVHSMRRAKTALYCGMFVISQPMIMVVLSRSANLQQQSHLARFLWHKTYRHGNDRFLCFASRKVVTWLASCHGRPRNKGPIWWKGPVVASRLASSSPVIILLVLQLKGVFDSPLL